MYTCLATGLVWDRKGLKIFTKVNTKFAQHVLPINVFLSLSVIHLKINWSVHVFRLMHSFQSILLNRNWRTQQDSNSDYRTLDNHHCPIFYICIEKYSTVGGSINKDLGVIAPSSYTKNNFCVILVSKTSSF